MRLTILGRWGAYPAAGEATSGYLLQYQGFNLLLDCGSGVLAQLQKHISIEDLDALLITHFHHDHVADVGCLQYAMMISQILGIRKQDLPIFAPDKPNEKYQELLGTKGTVIKTIGPDRVLNLGGLIIRFMETIHPIYCLAVRIESPKRTIVYTADTSFFPELVSFADGADCLLAETSFYADQKADHLGHMNAYEVGRLAKEANVKQVLITHLPHFGNPDNLVQDVKSIYAGSVHLIQIGEQFSFYN